jgi:primosomal protein N' (replication factor Y)
MPEQATKSFLDPAPIPEFVEIALPLPLRQTFTYSIPVGMRDIIKIGSRVLVPFGRRYLTGYAVVLHQTLSEELEFDEFSIKEITELLDDEPLITEEILRLTQWTADYYASSWGEVLKASLPAGINATVEEMISINSFGQDELIKTKTSRTTQIKLLRYLQENGETSLRELKKTFGTGKALRAVNSLLAKDLINKFSRTITTRVKPKRRKAVRLLPPESHKPDAQKISPVQKRIIDFLIEYDGEILFTELLEKADVGASPINTLAKYGFVEIFVKEIFRDPLAESKIPETTDFVLTAQQTSVLNEIKESLEKNKFGAFLLHGVTGSGKTEVYIRAMKRVLSKGRSSLMLVPEIALTPVFSKRLRAVFGSEVAILHSSLSTGERFDEWRRIRKGDARVVIGTRSAVFAPLRNLGLVVVDEEHDSSYRQHEMPFYNGRDVAIVRANFAGATVILGSATPAVESFHNSTTQKYKYLSLSKRVGNRPLAKAEIIDMREVFKLAGKDPVFSPALEEAIRETHERNEQSIILLNRRGFSQFVLCRSCGETIRCNNCDITLTFHKREQKIVCHYCNHRERVPKICRHCESKYLYFMGEGTEQIENLLQRKFSELKIARVDRDTTRKKHEMENILSAFSQKKLDMLVGTQMLAKGHDFPNVTLVGVISVDAGLSLPDFRSAEKTFQLLTQVAGRAGRGELAGRVLIQTYYPDHYALKHSKTQSYHSFYDQEITFRERMHYPPFVALSSILIKHPNYNYAHDNARILRTALDNSNTKKQCIVLGPAPAPLPRLKGEHRLQILVKSRNRRELRKTLDFALAEAESNFCDLKIVYVEIDPINLL